MGGAVSSGESNDDLIDNLLEADYIKNPLIERVFRAVDRALYYTQAYKMNAYKDLAWKDGNLHLSAPCIYSEVMENIQLQPGMSFLNIGSGTGYLSTMCGLMIGSGGINHGIELYPDVVEYARNKQDEFIRLSPAVDIFDFCPPKFVVGNCLDPIISCQQRYDRIYCGAACPEDCIRNITDLLKIGGICVIPINDSLVQITRVSENKEDRKSLLPVSFANLISPKSGGDKRPVRLPDWNPPSLQDLCRSEIRMIIRTTLLPPATRVPGEDGRKKRRRRRQERRRASRLLVVQRRRSGGEDGETGFVAVAYSVGNNSSDEDLSGGDQRRENGHGGDFRELRRENDDEEMQGQNGLSGENDEDDFELPDLEDDAMEPPEATVPAAPETIEDSAGPSAPAPVGEPESPSAGSSSGNRGSENGHSNREAPSSSAGRSRGFRGFRARTARQGGGTDGIFERLREIYRRREQQGRVDILRQFEQNVLLQQLSSICTSNSTVVENPGAVAPMEDENSVPDPSNSNPRGSRSTNAANNRDNNNSSVWSTDSSLESSSSSSSSSDSSDSDEEDGIRELTERNNRSRVNGGTAIDTDGMEEASVSKKTDSNEEQEDLPVSKLKKHPFSIQMKTKINELPLPPSIKVYLNYSRQF